MSHVDVCIEDLRVSGEVVVLLRESCWLLGVIR